MLPKSKPEFTGTQNFNTSMSSTVENPKYKKSKKLDTKFQVNRNPRS